MLQAVKLRVFSLLYYIVLLFAPYNVRRATLTVWLSISQKRLAIVTLSQIRFGKQTTLQL